MAPLFNYKDPLSYSIDGYGEVPKNISFTFSMRILEQHISLYPQTYTNSYLYVNCYSILIKVKVNATPTILYKQWVPKQ